jgi:Aromatic-ring hydroxylase, C-terminal
VLAQDGTTRLFGILRRGRHVMVVTGASPDGAVASPVLEPYRELLEVVTSCHGLPRSRAGSVVLVRPDGYIAARGTPDKLDTVLDYLRELMVDSQAG